MNTSATPSAPNKPIGVYILAGAFVVAPLGNLILSLMISRIPGWYRSQVFLPLLKTIPVLDWLWLGSLELAGILLWFRHKTAWAMAVLSLFFVIGINLYKLFFPPSPDLQIDSLYFLLVFSTTVIVLIIAFYFRFPYLDRRAQWFLPTAHRYDLRSPVQVVAHDIFNGVTESISISGARIRLQQDMGESGRQLRFIDIIFPDIRNIKVTSEVVEYGENILRVRYKRLTTKERAAMREWIQSQIEIKV